MFFFKNLSILELDKAGSIVAQGLFCFQQAVPLISVDALRINFKRNIDTYERNIDDASPKETLEKMQDSKFHTRKKSRHGRRRTSISDVADKKLLFEFESIMIINYFQTHKELKDFLVELNKFSMENIRCTCPKPGCPVFTARMYMCSKVLRRNLRRDAKTRSLALKVEHLRHIRHLIQTVLFQLNLRFLDVSAFFQEFYQSLPNLFCMMLPNSVFSPTYYVNVTNQVYQTVVVEEVGCPFWTQSPHSS